MVIIHIFLVINYINILKMFISAFNLNAVKKIPQTVNYADKERFYMCKSDSFASHNPMKNVF